MDLFRMFGQGGGGLPMGLGGGMGGGMLGMGAPQGPFRATYRCYPVVMMANKASLESGDKIILPASALDTLARLRVTYPMMFSLVNPSARKESRTHSGVMEFSAEEGTCYVPYWMMQNLLIESGGLLEVTNVSLKKGSFVKFQPHSVKFTQLHNPRVVLERALRNFSCLTKGDTIAIQHGSDNFYLDVMELKPDNAVSIIETDINVDFEPAKDAPAYTPAAASSSSSSQAEASFAAPSTNLTAGAGVTAADRDFSTGGWGSSGTETTDAPASGSAASSTGSDYFSKLGSGNKLSSKRKANASASPAAQASPSPSPVGAAHMPSSYSLNSLSAAKSDGTGLQRPQSALAGRSGGYSMIGNSSARPAAAAAAASSSSSSAAASAQRPTSATPAHGTLGGAGKTMVIERQGQWNYHYEVDGKGGKRLVRRLPARDAPPSSATTTAPAAASSSSAPVSGLAALGPGHRLK